MENEGRLYSPWIGDALVVTDVQNDFLPGGSLAVAGAEEVIPVLNRYIERFVKRGVPVFATRDWHPSNHCSFHAYGGPWPPHCIADTFGAQFPAGLALPPDTQVISKAMAQCPDAYSGFGGGSDLALRLHEAGVRRVFIGGLTTDYCVLNSIKDATALGFDAVLLADAVRAVNVHPGDGDRAIAEMLRCGAQKAHLEEIEV